VSGKNLLGISDQPEHRLRAERWFGAYDRRRHLIGRKEVERKKAGATGEAERRVPGEEIDDLRSGMAVDAPEAKGLVVGRYAAPEQEHVDEIEHSGAKTPSMCFAFRSGAAWQAVGTANVWRRLLW